MEIALIALVAVFLFLRQSSPSSAGTDPNAYGPPPAADSPYGAGPNAASGGTGDVGTWNGTPVPEKTAPAVAAPDKVFATARPPGSFTTQTNWRGVAAPPPPGGTFIKEQPMLSASNRTAPTSFAQAATASSFPKALSPAAPFITVKPPMPPPPMLRAAPAPATFTQAAAPSKLQLVTKQPPAASPIRLQKPGSTFSLR